MFSVKSKIPNYDTVRPLNYLGHFIFSLIFIIDLLRYRFKNNIIILINKGNYLIFLSFFIYIFIYSLFGTDREIKDFLYFVYWALLIPNWLVIYFDKTSIEESILSFCSAVLIYSIMSSIIALLVYWGLFEFTYKDFFIKQNYWTIDRIHGYLGDPTALGGLIGLSLICLSFLKKRTIPYFYWIISGFLIISLILTGSRNTLVALMFTYSFNVLLGVKKKTILKCVNLALLSIPFLIVLFIIFSPRLDIDYASLFSSLDRKDITFSNKMSRLFIWYQVLTYYLHGSLREIIFGFGVVSNGREFGSTFNVILSILCNYGIIGLVLYLFSIISSLYVGVKRYYHSKRDIYKLGVMLIIFGFSFSLFMSNFQLEYFNFPGLAFVFGITLISMPIRIFKNK